MQDQELLGHLVDLARRLDFEVRFDQGPFRDGHFHLPPDQNSPQDRRIIVLNRNSPAQRKVTALGRALKNCSLEDVFLLPAVRESIENAGNLTEAEISNLRASTSSNGETPSQPSSGRQHG